MNSGSRHSDSEPASVQPTAEERAALLALGRVEAMAALEREDPLALALATEFISLYAEKITDALKNGRDYLPLFTPADDIPHIERIAMEIVLESVEDELESEYEE